MEQTEMEYAPQQLLMTRLLHNAVVEGDLTTSTELLCSGARADVVLREGSSPLHLAVGLENTEVSEELTRLMLEAGSNPNVRSSDGVTPVHIAAVYGRCNNLQLLLLKGGNPFLEDSDGVNAFTNAQSTQCAVCLMLLEQWRLGILDTSSLDCSGAECLKYQDLETFDPQLHQIDVTSPDHPCLVPRSCVEKTLLAASSSRLQDFFVVQDTTTDGTSDSASFHTCSGNSTNDTEKSDLTLLSEESKQSYCSDSASGSDEHLTQDSFQLDAEEKCTSSKETSESDVDITSDSLAPFLLKEAPSFEFSSSASSASETISSANDSELAKSNATICAQLDSLTIDDETSPSAQASDGSLWDAGVWRETSKVADVGMPAFFQGRGKERAARNSVLSTASTGSEGSMCSCRSTSSTLTFVYTDAEEGFSLLETQVLPPVHCDSHLNDDFLRDTISSDSTVLYEDWQDTDASHVSVSEIPLEIQALSNSTLRKELVTKGENPGPITSTTRKIYEQQLTALKQNPSLKLPRDRDEKQDEFSAEVRAAVKGELDCSLAQQLDSDMAAPFLDPDPKRRWREGSQKCSFNYLLLDPRVTCNLPRRVRTLGENEAMKSFLKAVFYIGKGKRSRPYSHFKEAIQHLHQPMPKISSKVKQILDIWGSGNGVISLHIFQNVIPVEAYTREACMIQALGLEKLTNQKAGDYYGPASTWTVKKRRQLGAFMLKRAFNILLSEGERQIRPHDMKSG